MKILIVDSVEYHQKIQQALGDGFEYVCHTNVKEALAEFRLDREQFSLMIISHKLDIGKLEGLTMAEIVRDERGGQLIIIITGSSMVRSIAQRLGVEAINKPFRTDRLATLVEQVLGQ